MAGRLASLSVIVVSIGEGAPQLQEKAQKITVAPQASETTVARPSAEAKYHVPAKWQNIMRNPAAPRWLQTHIPLTN